MKFQKYHGLGNDFIMVDYDSKTNYSKLAIKVCDRHTGVGADGLIAVKTNPLEMIYYNYLPLNNHKLHNYKQSRYLL